MNVYGTHPLTVEHSAARGELQPNSLHQNPMSNSMATATRGTPSNKSSRLTTSNPGFSTKPRNNPAAYRPFPAFPPVLPPLLPMRNHISRHAGPPHDKLSAVQNSDLLEVVKAIQRELQCCGCRKPLRSARLCFNGHGLCLDCKQRCGNLCPQCKVPTMNENPAIIENIIKLLPRHCEFIVLGCKMDILPKDNEHEKFCRFRFTCCEMRDCVWTGPAKDLMIHLEEKHNKELVRTAKKTQILVDFDCTVDRKSAVPILAFNNVFWQHTIVKNKRLLQYYRYLPMGKPIKMFSVFVSFHTPELEKHFFTPVHIDIRKQAEMERDRRTFCLTEEDTASFHRFYSGVHYTFEVNERKM